MSVIPNQPLVVSANQLGLSNAGGGGGGGGNAVYGGPYTSDGSLNGLNSIFDKHGGLPYLTDDDYTPLCKNCRHSLSCVIDSTKPSIYRTCDEDGYEKLGCKTAKSLDEKYAANTGKHNAEA